MSMGLKLKTVSIKNINRRRYAYENCEPSGFEIVNRLKFYRPSENLSTIRESIEATNFGENRPGDTAWYYHKVGLPQRGTTTMWHDNKLSKNEK